jgi:hypothetical protein
MGGDVAAGDGLADAGAGRHDHQLPGLKPAGHPVEAGEAGGQPGQAAAALAAGLHVGQHVAERSCSRTGSVVAVVQQGLHPGFGFGGDLGRRAPGGLAQAASTSAAICCRPRRVAFSRIVAA